MKISERDFNRQFQICKFTLKFILPYFQIFHRSQVQVQVEKILRKFRFRRVVKYYDESISKENRKIRN